MWASVEKPVEERVPLSVLRRAKDLLISWGIPKGLLWVDPSTNTLSYEGDPAISTIIVDLNLKIHFGKDWGEYVKGDDWDKLIKETCEGLTKKR